MVLPMSVRPSLRTLMNWSDRLSISMPSAVTLRSTMLFSPFSASPAPQTTILPITVTFSSSMLPRPRPPLMYRLPVTTVSFSFTPEVLMVMFPYTPPAICSPVSWTSVPRARTRKQAICPRVMMFFGRKVPS